MTNPDEFDQPVFRDKRRVHVDPETGVAAGTPGAAPTAPGTPEPAADVPSIELSQLRTALDERTADLQRVNAEYANYRKRADRDREAARDLGVAQVFAELLPVLDDIGRAREHGELVGGFKQVAEALEATTARLGLERFGEVGDPFDPTMHEALTHVYSPDVSEPTCVVIMQDGYSYRGRIVRPARVGVAEQTEEPEPIDTDEQAEHYLEGTTPTDDPS